MPDFEVNEGYIEAGRRRADSPLPGLREDDRVSADGYVTADGRSTAIPGVRAGEDADAAEATEAGEDRHRLPEETPIVRRTRHLAAGHLPAGGSSARRVGVRLMARRRRLARRACPYGWQVRVLGTPPRHRRRLWTMCHGSPGSLS
jgi:hypothetical protein